jgi:hypothetical protein
MNILPIKTDKLLACIYIYIERERERLNTGGTEADITARIRKTMIAISALNKHSTAFSTQTKLRIFYTNVKAVLLYGCETWKNLKSITAKLQVFINECLRKIIRIFWPEQITNNELWKCKKRRTVLEEAKGVKKTRAEIKSDAKDRMRWRILVEALCSSGEYIYRVSQEECARLRKSVPYVKI